MSLKYNFLYASITLLLLGCKTYRSVDSVTVKTGNMVEAKFNIPIDFKGNTLLIVDRTDCMNEPFNSDNQDPSRNNIKNNLFNSLEAEIELREFYQLSDEVKKSESFCSNTPFPSPMKKEKLKEYTQENKMLVSVEKLSFRERDDFRQERERTVDQNDKLLSSRNVIIGKKVITSTLSVKFYDSSAKILDSTIIVNEYEYESKGASQRSSENSLNRGRDLALENAGKKLGFEVADLISPYYFEVQRNYFAFSRYNTMFSEAYELIKESDDWELASNMWQAIVNSDSKDEDRAKAYFNLGVYNEKTGAFKEALEMSEQSAALDQEVGQRYLQDLRNRYQNM